VRRQMRTRQEAELRGGGGLGDPRDCLRTAVVACCRLLSPSDCGGAVALRAGSGDEKEAMKMASKSIDINMCTDQVTCTDRAHRGLS
jgi:hypothetical protein